MFHAGHALLRRCSSGSRRGGGRNSWGEATILSDQQPRMRLGRQRLLARSATAPIDSWCQPQQDTHKEPRISLNHYSTRLCEPTRRTPPLQPSPRTVWHVLAGDVTRRTSSHRFGAAAVVASGGPFMCLGNRRHAAAAAADGHEDGPHTRKRKSQGLEVNGSNGC